MPFRSILRSITLSTLERNSLFTEISYDIRPATTSEKDRQMSSVQAAEGLPDGWVTRRIPRPSESKKTDLKWYSPKLGLRFSSKKDALRFVTKVNRKNGDEAAAILERMLPASSLRPAIHEAKEAKHQEAGVSAESIEATADKATASQKGSAGKFRDKGETEKMEVDEIDAIEPTPAPATIPFDPNRYEFYGASGKPSDYNERHVYLSFVHPAYKVTMYAKFRTLGRKSEIRGNHNDASNELLHEFKKEGGNFFRPKPHTNQFHEVDEDSALESECLPFVLLIATCMYLL